VSYSLAPTAGKENPVEKQPDHVKKPYESPRIVELGTIPTLTQLNAVPGNGHGGHTTGS